MSDGKGWECFRHYLCLFEIACPFYLIHENRIRNALVFTKSTESTVRLLRLFEYFSRATYDSTEVGDDWAAKSVKADAFSIDLAPYQRTAALDSFKRQEVGVYVCVTL